jgi:hypothetical protein|tara:strand:+ start:85 stop:957 length:873 start_codon:yes stop_codon:yes gene_type:complete
MSKLDDARKKGVNTLTALAIIAIAVYVGFTPLYEKIGGGVAGAVVGASFGAIFVIILTMYLLNKQTEIEQESKRGEKVFEQKMNIYWKVFDDTQSMLKDGHISKEDEMQKLPFVMMKLIAIGDDEVIKAYQKVYKAMTAVFEGSKEDKVKIENASSEIIISLLSNFANECRVDLGVSSEKVKDDIFDAATSVISQSGEIMSGNNPPIKDPDNPVAESEKVTVEGKNYTIDRHKKGHIRIYKDGMGEPLKGSKGILKKIDKKYKLALTETDWLQTQRAGKAVINKLKEQKS